MDDINQTVTYSEIFWLFIVGSLLGVLLEGTFCLLRYGQWETHTVAVWGPFCIIYGIGAVVLYIQAILLQKQNIVIQFIGFALITTMIEYLCGALLKYGLHMRAWDYSKAFWNIDGLICLKFTAAWGLAGVVFARWGVPALKLVFSKMNGIGWHIACICFSIFMAVNLLVTAACIFRWSRRHQGVPPNNQIEQYIDQIWDDGRMEKRFCEWRFIEK